MTATTDAPAQALANYRGPRITKPGVYDIPADVYHRDPVPWGSLSTSGAKKLLPPGCPALFQWDRQHPKPPTKALDLGTAAHTLVLGTGAPLVEVEADSWRSSAAQDAAADARLDGAVPLLTREYRQVHDMAEALRSHPAAARLLSPEWGLPEQSVFWRDRPTGVMRRCRLDVWPHPTGSRMIIPEFKTCLSADDESVSQAIYKFGYAMQGDAQLEAARTLGGADSEAMFVLVLLEKNPPYLVRVVEVDVIALKIGRDLNRQAIDLYAECAAADVWPGRPTAIEPIGMPAWVENNHVWIQP